MKHLLFAIAVAARYWDPRYVNPFSGEDIGINTVLLLDFPTTQQEVPSYGRYLLLSDLVDTMYWPVVQDQQIGLAVVDHAKKMPTFLMNMTRLKDESVLSAMAASMKQFQSVEYEHWCFQDTIEVLKKLPSDLNDLTRPVLIVLLHSYTGEDGGQNCRPPQNNETGNESAVAGDHVHFAAFGLRGRRSDVNDALITALAEAKLDVQIAFMEEIPFPTFIDRVKQHVRNATGTGYFDL